MIFGSGLWSARRQKSCACVFVLYSVDGVIVKYCVDVVYVLQAQLESFGLRKTKLRLLASQV